MKRLFLYFLNLIIVYGMAYGSGKFVITFNDGYSQLSDDITIRKISDEDYTIGDIPVGNIRQITYSRINSDNKGDIIDEGNLEFQKGVAVWDTEPDENHNRNVYSAEYICEIAGLPYFTTTSLQEATNNAKMILVSSSLQLKDLNDDNFDMLMKFVEEGGVLVSPRINNLSTSDNLKELIGINNISGYTVNSDRHKVTWIDPTIPECSYFDDEREITYSLGKGVYSTGTTATIQTQPFNLTETDTAQPLALYNNGEPAVIKNEIGEGSVYTFGVEWKNVIQRSQNNKDPDAQRGASNSFDPSADIYSFFLRSVYVDRNPVAAWKYTVPAGFQSVLVPTHDCDSQTAYNEMHFLADYEKSLGLKSHYFLTVHYYRDPGYLSAFYNEGTKEKISELLNAGHTIGSHSIGHFPDFNNNTLFPMTPVSREEYEATCSRGTNDETQGGSTWAEVVLSKQILNDDFPETEVKSFRSGHLCFNSNIPEALKEGNYFYSSCHTAADVLSQFPYFQRMMPGGNSYTGELTDVLQIPLHFSDVFNNDSTPIDEDHYKERVEDWLKIFNSLKNNYASSVLLIHPNREWKMWAQRELIDKLDREEVGLYNFEEYGDFWVNRSNLKFDLAVDSSGNRLVVKIPGDSYKEHLGVMIESKEMPSYITLIDENFEVLPSTVKKMGDGKYLLLFTSK